MFLNALTAFTKIHEAINQLCRYANLFEFASGRLPGHSAVACTRGRGKSRWRIMACADKVGRVHLAEVLPTGRWRMKSDARLNPDVQQRRRFSDRIARRGIIPCR